MIINYQYNKFVYSRNYGKKGVKIIKLEKHTHQVNDNIIIHT